MTEKIRISKPTDSWSSEDFIEPAEQDLVEDDPWSYDILPDWDSGTGTRSSAARPSQSFDGTVGLIELSNDDLLPGADDAYEVHYGLEEALPAVNDTQSIDVSAFEEPEPDKEGKSNLRQSLYDQYDRYLNISQKIKINEFIATLEAVEEDQISHIVELLEGLGNAKLMRWLPWLRDQVWTGASLSLFLEFRVIWESTPQWWETSFWSDRDGWHLYYNTYSMNLDDTYELIQSRLGHSSDEVVDKRWVEEWESQTPWCYGFLSFASFIIFRSVLNDHADWRTHVDYDAEADLAVFNPEYNTGRRFEFTDDVISEYSSFGDKTPLPYMVPSPEDWFALQSSYDPSDWHDNLGWSALHAINGILLPIRSFSAEGFA